MLTEQEAWKNFIGKEVIVDTTSDYIYLGTLQDLDEWFIILREVDVHNRAEGSSTNEKYIMDAKKFGVRVNRKSVFIRKPFVVSISKLEDVIEY